MNRSLTNPFVQIGLLLSAFAFGTLISLSIPTPEQLTASNAAELSQAAAAPAPLDTAAVLKSFDQAPDVIGVDVDLRRLRFVSHLS